MEFIANVVFNPIIEASSPEEAAQKARDELVRRLAAGELEFHVESVELNNIMSRTWPPVPESYIRALVDSGMHFGIFRIKL